MLTHEEILIGNEGSDYVAIRPVQYGREDWLAAEVRIACGGWSGRLKTSFMKGELKRFAERLTVLQDDLSAVTEFEPLESYIKLHFAGDGKGHIHVKGEAYSEVSVNTQLSFAFDIDQTYLKNIVDSLLRVDSGWKVP
jgi:hypothetical protein